MGKKAVEVCLSTRDKILHSAAVLFLEKGYLKTTIVDIAKHAGSPAFPLFR